jgi:hypothetical protein
MQQTYMTKEEMIRCARSISSSMYHEMKYQHGVNLHPLYKDALYNRILTSISGYAGIMDEMKTNLKEVN